MQIKVKSESEQQKIIERIITACWPNYTLVVHKKQTVQFLSDF